MWHILFSLRIAARQHRHDMPPNHPITNFRALLLFEPKVLTGWERWDSEAVAAGKAKPVGKVSEDDNLLIKGNNLLALYSLKARYAGKVKLIYIDPPYNTGNDGFRYNDRFNHSAWLTFMRNRLEVAKELLSRDGTVFLHLDDGEVHYCCKSGSNIGPQKRSDFLIVAE